MPAVGIDLGSTYCSVAISSKWKPTNLQIISNEMGETIIPSCIAFTETQILIGTLAQSQAARNIENTIFNPIQLLGEKYNSVKVSSYVKSSACKIVKASSESDRAAYEVKYKGERRTYLPEAIVSMLLLYLKKLAEKHTCKPITCVSITVPQSFYQMKRLALQTAAQVAGFTQIRLLNCCSAAALVLCHKRRQIENNLNEYNALIFDFGGKTLDVSLTCIDNDVVQMNASTGSSEIGGQNLDDILIKYFVKEFKNKHNVDLTQSKRSLYRLRKECERAKCILSSASKEIIEIDSLYDGIDLFSSISRNKFEELCMHYFQQSLELIDRVLQDSRISKSEVDCIALVGGSTRIPMLQHLIKKYFNEKLELCKSVQYNEVVAYGAAIHAATWSIMSNEEFEMLICGFIKSVLELQVPHDVKGVIFAFVVETKEIKK
eukprot:166219_1